MFCKLCMYLYDLSVFAFFSLNLGFNLNLFFLLMIFCIPSLACVSDVVYFVHFANDA